MIVVFHGISAEASFEFGQLSILVPFSKTHLELSQQAQTAAQVAQQRWATV